MKIGIICKNDKGIPIFDSIRWIYEELKRRNIETVVSTIDKIRINYSKKFEYSFNGKEIDLCLFWDTSRRYESIMILKELEYLGTPTLNCSEALSKSSNKHFSYLEMVKNGIEVPKTYFINSYQNALNVLEAVEFPLVLKPLYGLKGVGMKKFDNLKEAKKSLKEEKYPLLFQEFIEKENNRDLRVYVVGGSPIAGMYRYSKDWITNISRGGRAEIIDTLPSEVKDISMKSASVMGLEIAAVDIFETKSGYLSCETNDVPGFVALKELGVDLEKDIVDYMIDKIKK